MNAGRFLRTIFLVMSMTGAAVSARADAPPFSLPDETVMARLRAGELLLENDTTDEKGASATVLIYIHAPVQRIWAVIVSCDDAYAFVAGLQECQVLQERGDYAVTHQVVDKGWTMPKMDFTFETERIPYRHMAFRLTKGNLKTMYGTWDFRSYPEGVLVRHSLVLEPSMPAPRWLVRRNLNKDLPDMMRCIRALANGSSSDEAIRADLSRCPGKVGQPAG